MRVSLTRLASHETLSANSNKSSGIKTVSTFTHFSNFIFLVTPLYVFKTYWRGTPDFFS